MRRTTLLLMLAACLAAPLPATAGDDGKPEVAQVRADLARVNAEQRARTDELKQLMERISAETERANRMAIRAANAENELAIVKEKLAKAEATITALRGDR